MRPTTSIALLLGLVGCDNLFNLQTIGDRTGSSDVDADPTNADAFVPAHCSSQTFPINTPTALPELHGEVLGDPFMTADRLSLYYVKAGTAQYEIWRASRTSPTAPFEIATARESFNVPAANNADPSLTLDGEQLFFTSDTTNGRRLFSTARTNETWSAPALVPGLESATVQSAQIAWDGLTVYFVDATGDLVRALRGDRQSAFGSTLVVRAAATDFPSVSADDLEVFANSGGSGIAHVARTSTSVQFGGLAVVLPFGKDPQLMASGTTLVIAHDTSIAVLERLCN